MNANDEMTTTASGGGVDSVAKVIEEMRRVESNPRESHVLAAIVGAWADRLSAITTLESSRVRGDEEGFYIGEKKYVGAPDGSVAAATTPSPVAAGGEMDVTPCDCGCGRVSCNHCGAELGKPSPGDAAREVVGGHFIPSDAGDLECSKEVAAEFDRMEDELRRLQKLVGEHAEQLAGVRSLTAPLFKNVDPMPGDCMIGVNRSVTAYGYVRDIVQQLKAALAPAPQDGGREDAPVSREVERLREALQPFADLACLFDEGARSGNMPGERDDDPIMEWPRVNANYLLTAGHLRNARAAIAAHQQRGK